MVVLTTSMNWMAMKTGLARTLLQNTFRQQSNTKNLKKKIVQELERWLNGDKHQLPLQRIQV